MSETTSSNFSMAQPNFSGSYYFPSSRPSNLTDPVAAKRISFYKSGDPRFHGVKMVITKRSFKTFDALLDNLSKKVPLPFGVRNITTPRGAHHITNLDELEDGGSYICSQQRKIRPINLEQASKKPLMWKSSRPLSVLNPFHQGSTVARRVSKKLVVFKNGDVGVKHTVVWNLKTMQNFNAFLDHVTEVMEYPVINLYTTDGRKLLNTQALLLSSGAIVAAGREPFKPRNYNHEQNRLPAKLPGISNRVLPKTKSTQENRKSKFIIVPSSTSHVHSLPSNKIDSNDNTLDFSYQPDTFVNATDALPHNGAELFLIPFQDDIEKSVHVNPDGSMMVEMKVRFKLKEEETIQWTTKVSHSSFADKNCNIFSSMKDSGNQLSDLINLAHKGNDNMLCLENYDISSEPEKLVETTVKHSDSGSEAYASDICLNSPKSTDTSTMLSENKEKPCLHRPPTPWPRTVRQKQASVKVLETLVSEGQFQDNSRQFSYSEEIKDHKRRTDHCTVNQSDCQIPSTSSNLEHKKNISIVKYSMDGMEEEEMTNDLIKANSQNRSDMIHDEEVSLAIVNRSVEREDSNNLRSNYIPSVKIEQNVRPLSTNAECFHSDSCEARELKRSRNSAANCSESPKPQNKNIPFDCVLSVQSLGNNIIQIETQSSSNETSESTTTIGSSVSRHRSRQLSNSLENDGGIKSKASFSNNRKRSKTQNIQMDQLAKKVQSQQARTSIGEGTGKHEIVLPNSILSGGNQRSRMESTDMHAFSLKSTGNLCKENYGEGAPTSRSLNHISFKKGQCPQVYMTGKHNDLCITKKASGDKQMATIKPRSIKKISLSVPLKSENNAEKKSYQKNEIKYNLNTEEEHKCHFNNKSNMAFHVNFTETANGSSLIESTLNGMENCSALKSDLQNSLQTQNKHRKNKNDSNMFESKSKTVNRENAVDIAPKITHHSLESYVQSRFPNTLVPLNRKDEPAESSSIIHDVVNTALDEKPTFMIESKMHKIEYNPTKCNLVNEPAQSITKIESAENKSVKEFSGRQVGSVMSTTANVMERNEHPLPSDFQQSTNSEDQLFNEVDGIVKMKNRLTFGIHGRSASPRKQNADVAVQAKTELFTSTASTMTDASKDCVSDLLLGQLKTSSFYSIKFRKTYCKSLEKSFSLPDLSSVPPTAVNSSSKLVLAWCAILNLKESLATLLEDIPGSNGRFSEIFTLLQSLKHMSLLEEAHDLKAAVLNLQELTVNHHEKCKDSACWPENTSAKETNNVSQFCENDNLCKMKNENNFDNGEKHDKTQEQEVESERFNDLQKSIVMPAGSKDSENLCAFKTLFNRKGTVGDKLKYVSISNAEVTEKNETCETVNFQLESQHRCMNTFFLEGEMPEDVQQRITTEDENSNNNGVNSGEQIHPVELETFASTDDKGTAPYDNNENDRKIYTERSTREKNKLKDNQKCNDNIFPIYEHEKEFGNEEEKNSIYNETLGNCSFTSFSLFSCCESSKEKETDTIDKKPKVKKIVQEMERRKYSGTVFESKKCFQHPSSDYRSDSEGSGTGDYTFRQSSERNAESGAESTCQTQFKIGHVKRTIERLYGKAEASLKVSHKEESVILSKSFPRDSYVSVDLEFKGRPSVSQEHESQCIENISRPSIISEAHHKEQKQKCNTGSADNTCFSLFQTISDRGLSPIDDIGGHCTKQHCKADECIEKNNGVLIDKGRWLLNENHLVRRSPPENNLETISVDTVFDNSSDDVSYSKCGNQYHPLAEVSSSELEDMVRPHQFRYNYFNMPHGSDPEPFNDNLQGTNGKSKFAGSNSISLTQRKENDDCSEEIRTSSLQNIARIPAFTTVEFRLPGNKVHPLGRQPNDDQLSNAHHTNKDQVKEQDSLDKLHFICGQHCPILLVIIKPLDEEGRGFAYCKASDFENQLGVYHQTEKKSSLLQSYNNLQRDKNNNIDCISINEHTNCIFQRLHYNKMLDFITRGNYGQNGLSLQDGDDSKTIEELADERHLIPLKRWFLATKNMNLTLKSNNKYRNNQSEQILYRTVIDVNNNLSCYAVSRWV
ncbi:oxygen-regulated protein 1 [Microcaecilia unicolor]|uniref:Oxygen-regulated protein 1 n=1 Tax=Microcaecilia unicolor TaxID=1415580 RepID=A0A6P7X4U7_9AMPH|nr:oxygen-regulated protein 1 [Microcaecilia unicolor]